MSYSKDGRTAFSNEGFRLRRTNPDGTQPTPTNHLGFLGSIACSTLTATDELSYRFDGTGEFTELVIDLSALTDDEDVDSVVTALNDDTTGFGAVFTASKDEDTERLKIVDDSAESHDYLEIKGTLAVFFGFGQYGDAEAMGTAFVECFDDSAAIGMAKNNKDSEEVEQEAGNGTLQTMIIDAQVRGLNPSIAMTDEKYELKELFMGGSWNDETFTYTPPTTELVTKPRVCGEVYVPKYAKGSMHRGDLTGYKVYNILNMTGHETDVTHDVKSWASYSFDCQVTEYTTDGTKYPGWTESELTVSEFEALGIAS